MIDKIVSLMVEEALTREGCQNTISAIHSVKMDISLKLCELFKQIREQEALIDEKTCS